MVLVLPLERMCSLLVVLVLLAGGWRCWVPLALSLSLSLSSAGKHGQAPISAAERTSHGARFSKPPVISIMPASDHVDCRAFSAPPTRHPDLGIRPRDIEGGGAADSGSVDVLSMCMLGKRGVQGSTSIRVCCAESAAHVDGEAPGCAEQKSRHVPRPAQTGDCSEAVGGAPSLPSHADTPRSLPGNLGKASTPRIASGTLSSSPAQRYRALIRIHFSRHCKHIRPVAPKRSGVSKARPSCPGGPLFSKGSICRTNQAATRPIQPFRLHFAVALPKSGPHCISTTHNTRNTKPPTSCRDPVRL